MLALSPLSYAASALALLSAVAGQTPNRVNGTLATQLQLQAAEAHLRRESLFTCQCCVGLYGAGRCEKGRAREGSISLPAAL